MLGIAPWGGYHMPPGVFRLEHEVLLLDEDTLNKARKSFCVTIFRLAMYTWQLEDEFILQLSNHLVGVRL